MEEFCDVGVARADDGYDVRMGERVERFADRLYEEKLRSFSMLSVAFCSPSNVACGSSSSVK